MTLTLKQPSGPEYKFGRALTESFFDQIAFGKVGVIMGSDSDWPFMKPCVDMLEKLEIQNEHGVVSAHRTGERMMEYARLAEQRGLKVIIAMAGGSAHLPGMVASETLLPVIGVAPKKTDEHAVGSMIAMPSGKPLAYLGGGSEPGKNAGAVNAALFAARILALTDPKLLDRLDTYNRELGANVPFSPY